MTGAEPRYTKMVTSGWIWAKVSPKDQKREPKTFDGSKAQPVKFQIFYDWPT